MANLFDELRTKRLLLIGNAHPDWLARFFVRLARRDRLYSGNDAREFVADGAVVADVHLRDFLENFSPQTKSFGVANPIEFVDQLAEKWDAFPDKPSAARSGTAAVAAAAKPPAVFISYASQDREAVERLQASLSGVGLDVWFDKGRLESGDPWWPVARAAISGTFGFRASGPAFSYGGRSEGRFGARGKIHRHGRIERSDNKNGSAPRNLSWYAHWKCNRGAPEGGSR